MAAVLRVKPLLRSLLLVRHGVRVQSQAKAKHSTLVSTSINDRNYVWDVTLGHVNAATVWSSTQDTTP